jgi:cytochrome P450
VTVSRSRDELVALAPIDSPDFYINNPHPTLSRIRKEAPVLRYEHLNSWLVSKYEDIRSMSRNPDVFCVAKGIQLNDARYGNITDSFFEEDAELISTTDPPRHADLRRAIAPAFTSRVVSALADDLRIFLRRQFDAIEPGSEIEVMDQLALRLPIYAVARILGVPGDNFSDLKFWSDEMMKMGAALPPEELAEVAASFGPMNDFFLEILDRKRSDPGDDLLSTLVKAQGKGAMINDANVLMLASAALVAGNETTRTLLGWLAWAFASYPDQFQLLREDPSLASGAVDECLRFAPPVQGFLRTATQDTDVRGMDIKGGDHLFMMYLSANRDEDIFDDPDRFDIRRKASSAHIAFGWGQHLCVGAALARLEGRIFAEELAARYRELQLTCSPTRIRSVLQNGFLELPMVLLG